MGKIILVPIEPLEERYSKDWLQWFSLYCNVVINPEPLTNTITTGSFLDVCGTNYYKSRQLSMISDMIFKGEVETGDTFLFLDLWFPGIEMLAYMRDALGIQFKITGCLHAGTYDPFDFLAKKQMNRWAVDLENSWFELTDLIFVATEFHKKLILKRRKVDPSKIKVTGFPIIKPLTCRNKKENIVVFPHRLDSEKNPQMFDLLREQLITHHSDWLFVKTKDLKLTKQEYYDLLSKSKIAVSFADQETWGIAMQESVLLGCVPIVPDRLSYSEMYERKYKFQSFEEAVALVTFYMMYWEEPISNCQKIAQAGRKAISNILECINEI